MAYCCRTCHTGDIDRWPWCQRPDCPDGRDQTLGGRPVNPGEPVFYDTSAPTIVAGIGLAVMLAIAGALGWMMHG